MDLHFKNAPEDLMTKFIDCLIRLPNLRTLEVFSTTNLYNVKRGLRRKSAKFPSVRELVINERTAGFIRSCPNVEVITAPSGLSDEGAKILNTHGRRLKNLKRVVGVNERCVRLGEFRDML